MCGFSVIDLFAGAGGLSEGFFRTGYRFISHIEMDRYASMTLETRMIYHALKANGMEDVYYSYISGEISREELLSEGGRFVDYDTIIRAEISEENEKAIIKRIKEKMRSCNQKKVDIIIGGPPCQPY